ncbi:MAG: MarR family transcriptional regulator [Anaerolineae bacterium]
MDEQIGYLIKRAQQALRQEMDDALRALNLTTAQYAALSALEQTPKASNAALARACFVTPQTMIEIVKNLEASGCVTRQSHPEHGRIIQTILTENGRAKLADAHGVVGKIEERMLSGLKAAEQENLTAYLQKCCENLEEK